MPAKHSEENARAILAAADIEPISAYPGSIKPWRSKCLRCGEIIQPRLNAVKSGRRQCGYCSKSRIIESSAIKLMLKSGVTPIVDFPGGNRRWKSKCNDCGRIIEPTFANVKNGHKGCAYCSGKKIDSSSAESFMLHNNLQPLEKFKSSKSKWKCICKICENIVSPRYGDLVQGQGGCLTCGFKKSADQNRLNEQRAIQRMLDAGVMPLEKYKNFDSRWKSKCLTCSKIVYPTLHSATGGQGGCLHCGRKKASKSRMNLESKVSSIMKNSGYEPLEAYPGAALKWKCLHINCKKIVYPRFAQINNGSGGCRYCGYIVMANKNRIPSERALRIMVDAGLQPLESYKSASDGWKSIHLKCGKVVFPKLYKIIQGGGGCQKCSPGGLNFNLPAYLYLIKSSEYDSIKIGVGNLNRNRKDRIREHQKQGWNLYAKKVFSSGEKAYEIEQDVLFWLRKDLKLPPHLLPELMPQKGWTETVDASEIDLPTIWAKVEELSRVKR